MNTSLSGSRRGLPPPPPAVSAQQLQSPQQQQPSSYSRQIAASMTIEEMRQLHQRALQEAEAKRTELRLVLASRYRELVGSSDEVLRMKERATELHELVQALPQLLEKLVAVSNNNQSDSASSSIAQEEKSKDDETQETNQQQQYQHSQELLEFRRQLSLLPRAVHRALDINDIHTATLLLQELFSRIASQDVTNQYPLAKALASSSKSYSSDGSNFTDDPAVRTQMRLMFLQVQTLPRKMVRLAERNLLRAASYGKKLPDAALGAKLSAASLSCLYQLDLSVRQQEKDKNIGHWLLEKYYDSKAKLLVSLLNQLKSPVSSNKNDNDNDNPADKDGAEGASTDNAEAILSKIVLLLQHDVILHPYQIFILRKFPTRVLPQQQQQQKSTGLKKKQSLGVNLTAGSDNSDTPSRVDTESVDSIMSLLPEFDPEAVRTKCSKFLAAHLPLIRTKVKGILVSIAGTTASALGQIRQSLYDKTDGADSMQRLDDNGVCTWDEAVAAMIHTRTVFTHADAVAAGEAMTTSASGAGAASDGASTTSTTATSPRRFSLWSALFSNTFSSLVHSLLTTSFQSVHARVVATLRASLANAPPLAAILPHEAYRNTLRIATELDKALLTVSADAHELLVHAEERVESERRLRQSLYVQTCEIMGRLLCELRRMVYRNSNPAMADATKELIVGRLCYLLKFRLTALPTLLDPNHSPAVLLTTIGMISHVDLQSAFELADDNEDGLISFQEAMESVDSAFSGSPFHGAEMVRETLLITSAEKAAAAAKSSANSTPMNVTLAELTLLTARGLRHDKTGPNSALGTVQKSLDDIVEACFQVWAQSVLEPSVKFFSSSLTDFCQTAVALPEPEWKRVNGGGSNSSDSDSNQVSPFVVAYLLDVSSALNRTVCPSDSFLPVPSASYAMSLGIISSPEQEIPTLLGTVRWSLLRESLVAISSMMESAVEGGTLLETFCRPAVLQWYLDISFLNKCFLERNRYGFGSNIKPAVTTSQEQLQKLVRQAAKVARSKTASGAPLEDMVSFRQKHVFESSDLFLASLFGEHAEVGVSAGGELDLGMSGTATSGPIFRAPLASTRRFVLLPIQSDRSLTDLQLRGKYAKEKQEAETHHEATSGSVMSSGFGFFSSMLKKK